MKVAILKEREVDEARVAASPETIRKLAGLGFDAHVETGAGASASFPDAAFSDAGATIGKTLTATLANADVIFKVRPPSNTELQAMPRGALLAGLLAPYDATRDLERYASAGITTFALELLPRISRAQSMDVLSSQSNLAGYRAVIDAAAEFGRALPMMMTAAGTVAPARVLVMGAGVAGLQAIATARRLGAIVSATDVRPAAREQVESLGASFVMVEDDEAAAAETAGGYAREMSDDYQRQQRALIAETMTRQDIVICTALVPGRRAPQLIDEAMVRSMRPGSVIVDLAVESGGNCAMAVAGTTVDAGGVRIVGHLNMPGRVAVDASAMYARNLLNFITPLVDTEVGALDIDWEDEIIRSTCVTRDGVIVHPQFLVREAS
ncbi:MAG: Re/Si-specific NAD(P)(+) transhydrogenase subunit alpha [Pseudomonadota bacterium]